MKLNIKNFIFLLFLNGLMGHAFAWDEGADVALEGKIRLKFQAFQREPVPDHSLRELCPAVRFLQHLSNNLHKSDQQGQRDETIKMIQAVLYKGTGVGGISSRPATPVESAAMKFSILSLKYYLDDDASCPSIVQTDHERAVISLVEQSESLIFWTVTSWDTANFLRSYNFQDWAKRQKRLDQQLITVWRQTFPPFFLSPPKAIMFYLTCLLDYHVEYLERNPDFLRSIFHSDHSCTVVEAFSMPDNVGLALFLFMSTLNAEQLEQSKQLEQLREWTVSESDFLTDIHYFNLSRILPSWSSLLKKKAAFFKTHFKGDRPFDGPNKKLCLLRLIGFLSDEQLEFLEASFGQIVPDTDLDEKLYFLCLLVGADASLLKTRLNFFTKCPNFLLGLEREERMRNFVWIFRLTLAQWYYLGTCEEFMDDNVSREKKYQLVIDGRSHYLTGEQSTFLSFHQDILEGGGMNRRRKAHILSYISYLQPEILSVLGEQYNAILKGKSFDVKIAILMACVSVKLKTVEDLCQVLVVNPSVLDQMDQIQMQYFLLLLCYSDQAIGLLKRVPALFDGMTFDDKVCSIEDSLGMSTKKQEEIIPSLHGLLQANIPLRTRIIRGFLMSERDEHHKESLIVGKLISF